MSFSLARWKSWGRHRAELYTAVACVLLTGAHLGYRKVFAPAGPAPIHVSSLNVGAVVQGARLVAAPPGATCRVVITFSPDCPFCKRAAERERAADREGAYASSTWITSERRESLGAFEARLPANATRLVDGALYRSLGVRAVPGLYLLDAESRVHWVGPYRGDEDTALLDARCASAVPHVAADPTG